MGKPLNAPGEHEYRNTKMFSDYSCLKAFCPTEEAWPKNLHGEFHPRNKLYDRCIIALSPVYVSKQRIVPARPLTSRPHATAADDQYIEYLFLQTLDLLLPGGGHVRYHGRSVPEDKANQQLPYISINCDLGNS